MGTYQAVDVARGFEGFIEELFWARVELVLDVGLPRTAAHDGERRIRSQCESGRPDFDDLSFRVFVLQRPVLLQQWH